MPRPDSRAALVAAAAQLFRRQGYAATGVNQILEVAGVNAGSLYHHFPEGKAELAAAVVRKAGEDIESLLQTALAATPPAVAVCRWLDVLAEGLQRDARDGCPIEPLATESVHASDAVRVASARAFEGWCEVLAKRLNSDGWPPDAADRTARSIIALLEGALILSRTAKDRAAIDAAKTAARTLLDAPRR